MISYYVKQKLGVLSNQYTIYDDQQKICLHVYSSRLTSIWDSFFGNILSLGRTFTIEDLTGEVVCVIKEKIGFFCRHYDLYEKGEKIAYVSNKAISIHPKLIIEVGERTYQLTGDLFGWKFKLYDEG